MVDIKTAAANKIQDVGNACAQAASTAGEAIRSNAGNMAEQAKEMANRASSYLDSKANEATTAIGESLKSAGSAIRRGAPQEGSMGQASSAVAQTLADTGDYIETQGIQGIENDIANLIKKNPIPSLLMGVGLGFMLARLLTPRS